MTVGVEVAFIVRCNRCGECLMDGDAVMLMTSHPHAQIAAENDKWIYEDPKDDHINPAIICRTCVNRARIMHQWIKANAVIRTVS
jgi:hypothetical protein